MNITLSSPTHLRITWPVYDSAIDHEIRRRLSTVPGIEAGRGRVAWAPVIQLQRLMEMFPKASYEYAAIAKADHAARCFWDAMVRMGVIFKIDPMGAVYVDSESNSPVVEQLVADRSHALRPFVLESVTKVHGGNDKSSQQRELPVVEVRYPKRRRAKRKVQR